MSDVPLCCRVVVTEKPTQTSSNAKVVSRMPIKSTFFNTLNCTTRRRIPASASTDQEVQTGDIVLLRGYRDGNADADERKGEGGQPREGQITSCRRLDVYHTSPDFGQRQYNLKTLKRQYSRYRDREADTGEREGEGGQPHADQITFFHRLDVYHTSPDSGQC